MERDDDKYVVAVKREKRSDVPRDWLETVRGTPGVTMVGESNPDRVQVRATPEAVEEIRRRLGQCVYVERVVPHSRM